MRYLYSAIRFVPDPARAEFVNLGLIVGSEDTGEWVAQVVSRLERANHMDEQHVLPRVMAEVAKLETDLARVSEANEQGRTDPSLPNVDSAWLLRLSAENANILQYSAPVPVVANSAQQALDLLWGQLIVEPEARARNFVSKHRALGRVTTALRNSVGQEHFGRKALIETTSTHGTIDFAAHNGRIVELTQCWSFQVANTAQLLDDIKAWAWTIRDLRRSGGVVRIDGLAFDADRDVSLSSVYVPPLEDSDEGLRAFEEAGRAFGDAEVRADTFPLEEAERVGERARARLHA